MSTRETARKQILNLRATIAHHEHLYRDTLLTEITDSQFDDLVKQLDKLEAEYPEFALPREIEADEIPGRPTEPHEVPMLSLYSTTDPIEVGQFVVDVQGRLKDRVSETPRMVLMPKLDGMALSLEYRAGRLYKALTRGRKGEEGAVVTERVRLFHGVPVDVSHRGRFIVRGELIYDKQQLIELNATRPDNPIKVGRSAARAAITTGDELFARRYPPHLVPNFIAYSVIYPDDDVSEDTLTRRLTWLRLSRGGSKLFRTVPIMPVPDIKYASEMITALLTEEMRRDNHPTELDGLVITANHVKEGAALGATARHPNCAIAFKFKQKEAKTKLIDLEYEISRQGNLSILARVEPVEIMLKTITRPEVHQYLWVLKHRPAKGDILTVTLAKDIVPEITDIQSQHQFAPFELPVHCPSCKTPLVKRGSFLHCPNQAGCLAQQADRFANFVSTRALNIQGLGDKRMQQLVEKGLITRFGDVFRLTPTTLSQALRVAPDVAEALWRTIQRAKSTTFVRFIVGLGIPGIGNSTAKQLGKCFNCDLLAARAATMEELANVPGIGRQLAASTHGWLCANWDEVQDLLDQGVSWNVASISKKRPLDGQILLMSGKMEKPRSEMRALYQSLGAEVVDSYSKSVTALVVGEAPSHDKFQKAHADEKPIYTEDEFARQFQLTVPQGN